MNEDISSVIMNSARQRIMQYLILNETGTVSAMAAALSDIPKPSIYRHVNRLLEAEIIEVCSESPVRGTKERTLRLRRNTEQTISNKDISVIIQQSLAALMGSFAQYFDNDTADPVADMLSVSTSTLMLSDEELLGLLTRISEIIQEYIGNAPSNNRRARSITLVSAPPMG